MKAKMARILIIEDDANIRDIIRIVLSKHYELIFATNGQEALNLFGIYNFDLILLDIVMPGIDGFTVCQHLRRLSEIPIIMCSAIGRREDRVRAIESGATAYLTKPFAIKDLRRCLQSFL